MVTVQPAPEDPADGRLGAQGGCPTTASLCPLLYPGLLLGTLSLVACHGPTDASPAVDGRLRAP